MGATFRARHITHRPSRWAYVSWRYQMRRHTAEQSRVARVLAGDWRADVARVGQRMARCSDGFLAAVNLTSGSVGICPMHCDVSVCPVCLEHRSRTTLKKARWCVASSMAAGDILRHIVVTSPTAAGSVREAADQLGEWYRRLTRRGAWREHVRASMAVFETTWSEGTLNHDGEPVGAGWHWHAHIITVGRWWRGQCKGADGMPCHPDACECVERRGCCGLPQLECECEDKGRRNRPRLRCLMQEWWQVTGGNARIVHISAAGRDHRGRHVGDEAVLSGDPVNEAVKYVVKTMGLPDHALIQYVSEMGHFQRIRWGGDWFGVQPPDDREHQPRIIVAPTDLWRLSTGTIGSLFARLSTGDPLIVELVEAAGWDVRRFSGPMPQGRARPPPMVVLSQDSAGPMVASLETVITDMARKTTTQRLSDPLRDRCVDCTDVPY